MYRRRVFQLKCFFFICSAGASKLIAQDEKQVIKVSETKLVSALKEKKQKIPAVENQNISGHEMKKNPEHDKIPGEILNLTSNQVATTKYQPSWKSWGAFSIISNASKSVASITTQVSLHISSAIENLNIPEPEQMAKVVSEEERQIREDSSSACGVVENCSEKTDDNKFNMGSLFSGVSEMSSKMVSGGLVTLEGIGKKTINILQENDPNIKNKILGMSGQGNKPNLSNILKEAKDRPDDVVPMSPKSEFYYKPISFEQLLDDYKGLVYLEAIKILSNQSKMKIESLIKPLDGKALTVMEETLGEVKELCELPDSENFEEDLTAGLFETKLRMATEDLNLKVNFKEIVNFTREWNKWLNDLEDGNINIIYEKSLNVLAKSCALSLGNLQKLAELLLCMDHRNTADEADSLIQLVILSSFF